MAMDIAIDPVKTSIFRDNLMVRERYRARCQGSATIIAISHYKTCIWRSMNRQITDIS